MEHTNKIPVEPKKKIIMRREKEIMKEAKKFAKEIDEWEIAEDVQDAFEQGAQWADSHPHWISVEEELPPITQWVLTYNPTYDEYHFDVERYGRGENLVDFGVTHWMHLPPPPSSSEKPNNCEKGGEE